MRDKVERLGFLLMGVMREDMVPVLMRDLFFHMLV